MTSNALVLSVLPQALAVCRLAPDAPLPPWALRGELWSVTRTPDELSVVCVEAAVPADVAAEAGWRALRVVGTLDFALVGVLRAIAAPLAEAGVSIFAVSTYDTDYVLVRGAQLEQAIVALRGAGHTVSAP